MLTRYKHFVLASSAALLASACSKQEIQPEINPVAGGTYTYELTAKAPEVSDGADAKISIGNAVHNMYPCRWSEGDALGVFAGTNNVGTSTLTSGAGEQVGTFSLVSSASPGTKVRAIYPSDSKYGKGTLPPVQNMVNSKRSDISAYAHAYSNEFVLQEDGKAEFALSQALAVVCVEFSCKDLPGSAFLSSAQLSCVNGSLAGDFSVNYETGEVMASDNAVNAISQSYTGGLPGVSSTTNRIWMVAFPSKESRTYCVTLKFKVGADFYAVSKKYTAALIGNRVNVLNAKSFTMSNCEKLRTIHLCGDSICASASATNYRGWGQILPDFFDNTYVNVINHAVGGRSTKTFRSEGNWDAVKASLQPGDIVTLQFGHNDENTDARHTTPQEYYDNLLAFITETKDAGAVPVLLTPILRRRFVNNIVQDSVGDNWTHVLYAPKMHMLADSLGVPILDVLEQTRTWLNSLGDERSKNYFAWFRAGDYPSKPEGQQDNTHLNQQGAFVVARMIAQGLSCMSARIAGSYIDASYSDVEARLGKIKLYYSDGQFGAAGSLDGNMMLREYDDPAPVDAEYEVYTYPEGTPLSTLYSVKVEELDSPVLDVSTSCDSPDDYPTPINYTSTSTKQPATPDGPSVCVFGTKKPVTVKVKFMGGAPSSVRVAPLYKNYPYSLSGDELTMTLNTYDRICIEINGDLLHPLFIGVNPVEYEALTAAIADKNTLVLRGGREYPALDYGVYKKLYIQGGAVVKGYVRNTSFATDGFVLSGCGVINTHNYTGCAIDLHYADNATVSNLTVLNKKHWTCRFINCNNLTVDNLKAVSACPFNDAWDENDAIHFTGCTDVHATRCLAYSWDDAYCVNATYSYDEVVRSSREVYNISYNDCIGWNVRPGNSFEIGWSNNSDVHDVTYTNCCSLHSGSKGTGNYRAGFSIQNGGPGEVYNIRYENCYVEDPAECGITVTNTVNGSETHGVVHDVYFKNVSVRSTPPKGFTLIGQKSTNKVHHITYDNVTVAGVKVTSTSDPLFNGDRYPCKNFSNITFK